MSESRGYCYNGQTYTSIKCRRCEEKKPIWYFGVSLKTGERRKICKGCRARMKHRIRVHPNKRFEGVFDGLDFNASPDLNSNSAAQAMIRRRAEAVKALIFRELRDKHPRKYNPSRTIADEIQAGKRAWRTVRRLAWAPIPLELPEAI